MAVTARSGLSVRPGGNELNGPFLETHAAGMSVRFSVPATTGFTLDFGDGTAAVATDGSGYVDHQYTGSGPRPWVYSAALTDSDNRWRGWRRFEVPRGPYSPWDLAANAF